MHGSTSSGFPQKKGQYIFFKRDRSLYIVLLEACRPASPGDFRGFVSPPCSYVFDDVCRLHSPLPLDLVLQVPALSPRAHRPLLRVDFRLAPHPLVRNLLASLSPQCQRQRHTNNPGRLSEQAMPKPLWHIQS